MRHSTRALAVLLLAGCGGGGGSDDLDELFCVMATGGLGCLGGVPPPPPAPVPLAPVALRGHAGGSGEAVLSWDPVVHSNGIVLERALLSHGVFSIVAQGLRELTYVDAGLRNGAAYAYRAYAVNGTSRGPAGNTVEVVARDPNAPAPAAPAGLSAWTAAEGVVLAWRAAGPERRHVIRRAWLASGWRETIAADVEGERYADLEAPRGGLYRYEVAALGEGGEGSAADVDAPR
jgi:hypothetical protein